MLGGYPEKLREILRKKKPQLTEEEINKLTDQFLELGRLLVPFVMRRPQETKESNVSSDFEEKTRAPPFE
ncbi:MAG: hypothetical protein HYW90_02565 [Candidatus Sungbacteria bacterium]|nr:hypothetical protein [Candidatus Sungbacteria bacterium]